MIIFGTRGLTFTVESGEFNCPQCRRTENYRHRKVRKFFTLYFIPVIPLGTEGEYVECSACKGTFIPSVLDRGGSDQEFVSFYEKAIGHVMVRMMLADGKIDENEKVAVLEVINNFSNRQMTTEQLEAFIDEVREEHNGVVYYLKSISPSLNEMGKEMIIKGALHVAFSDGEFDESEKGTIKQMAVALEMSPAHLKGIFAEVFDSETSR